MDYFATKVTHNSILEQYMKQNEEIVAYDKEGASYEHNKTLVNIVIMLMH